MTFARLLETMAVGPHFSEPQPRYEDEGHELNSPKNHNIASIPAGLESRA